MWAIEGRISFWQLWWSSRSLILCCCSFGGRNHTFPLSPSLCVSLRFRGMHPLWPLSCCGDTTSMVCPIRREGSCFFFIQPIQIRRTVKRFCVVRHKGWSVDNSPLFEKEGMESLLVVGWIGHRFINVFFSRLENRPMKTLHWSQRFSLFERERKSHMFLLGCPQVFVFRLSMFFILHSGRQQVIWLDDFDSEVSENVGSGVGVKYQWMQMAVTSTYHLLCRSLNFLRKAWPWFFFISLFPEGTNR